MNPMAPMSPAYSRPMVKPSHPEMCGSIDPNASPTVSGRANSLNGQLTEALDRARRVLDRIQGAEPANVCGSPLPVVCLESLMAANCEAAGDLLVILDRIESRIGG